MIKIKDLKVGDLVKMNWNTVYKNNVARISKINRTHVEYYYLDGDSSSLSKKQFESSDITKCIFNHQMKLQEKWFKEIDNKPEFRLFDEKWEQIKLNDVIEFTCIETGEKVLRRVLKLEQVFLKYGEKTDACVVDIHDNEVECNFLTFYLKQELEDFYTQEQIDKYGLIAIYTEEV